MVVTFEMILRAIFIFNVHIWICMCLFIHPRTEKQRAIWDKVYWTNSYIFMGVLLLFSFF